jgi:hypothetical protein
MTQASDAFSGPHSPLPVEHSADMTELKGILEEQYWVQAEYAYTIPVRHFLGTLVWEGPVHVFGLKNHPWSSRAFAWTMSTGSVAKHHVALESRAVPEAAEAVRLALLGSGPSPR